MVLLRILDVVEYHAGVIAPLVSRVIPLLHFLYWRLKKLMRERRMVRTAGLFVNRVSVLSPMISFLDCIGKLPIVLARRINTLWPRYSALELCTGTAYLQS